MTYILQYNAFEFHREHFQQTCGTAIDTKMAPAFATLFMHKLEREFLSTQSHQPIAWIQYIDDIVTPCTHREDKLKALIHDLNNLHPTIKLTYVTGFEKTRLPRTIINI